MTTTATGRQAEAVAVDFLSTEGFEIISTNWRTRFCEIDIVANKQGIVYFAEVKYRVSNKQEDGLEYITSTKRRRMQFAAESWVAEHDWNGDYRLAGIEVRGASFKVTNFVEDI